ncbi:GMC oxidoreductase [Salinispora arenicola]|uniref:GMC oxidoreductase n=1 Tax=Salinispora arenicola TaxID=168697 RepID=UPI000371A36C|nr:GMC oxidoreductase [Salinispora arenicola]NIL55816.1 GMC family oxidoreductase [Salinispora arenicola]NIL61070.1 GMC family oxidoreductase [Salinispora arenicola]
MTGTSFSRRGLLRATTLGAGAAVAGAALAQRAAAAQGVVPALAGKTAVVVGSGFGGAVAAYRLGQAGVITTVLERGLRWDVDGSGNTFCGINEPDWRCGWFLDRPPLGINLGARIERRAGLIARHEGDGINVLSGVGVGGGSLAIGMFLPQPRRSEWEQVYPADVGYDEMNTIYWPRARQRLGASPIPEDVQSTGPYRGARAWLEYLSEFDQNPLTIPFAVDWDVIRAELAGDAVACHTIGEGPYGSNSGAKNSVDRNYLAWAAATGNVTTLPLHEVTEIHEVSGQDRFEVRCRQIDVYGTVLATRTFACDYLFLAAGSVYTTSLLLTSQAKGWLPRLVNPEVGKGWGNNGDFLVTRINLRKDVGYAQGGPGNVKYIDDDNPFAPTSMAWEAAPVPNWMPRTTAHLVTSMAPERGEIRYDATTGAAKVHWPYGVLQTTAEKAAVNLVTRLWWQTEGRKGYLLNGLPTYARGVGTGLGAANTWHPLGGMVMGGATDFGGRCVDYPNLFCVDGSILPGSACLANPALTITANAERCLDRFVAAHT